ncbi:MAG: hypothetical protein EOP61_31300, partial [Sphingomonadales bacterium]
MDQVPGEAVIIVDDEDHGAACSGSAVTAKGPPPIGRFRIAADWPSQVSKVTIETISLADDNRPRARSRIDSSVAISVADLFTIGIGPSSSHTVGPMRIARAFTEELAKTGRRPVSIRIELFGSLALTGAGHATDRAILLGLAGEQPETVDPAAIPALVERIRAEKRIVTIAGPVAFDEATDLLFRKGEFLEGHSNAVRLAAQMDDGTAIAREYHSIGGGAIVAVGDSPAARAHNIVQAFPFSSGGEMLAQGEETGLSIAAIVLRNEEAWRPRAETEAQLDR